MSKIVIEVSGYLDPIEEAAIKEVVNEYCRAVKKFGPFNSAHEGYGVILEELDELWDEIKAKQELRSATNMREEASQVAAMGLRFMIDARNFQNESKEIDGILE
jgi:hypothetical protein